jgi:outer membrane receptor protein involved in Fe transport
MNQARPANHSRVILKAMPLASAISAILVGAPPAIAQDQAESPLGELTVTATKREESLQNVPLSIQAIGEERLEELHITDFEDYVKFLPSVQFTSFGPGFSVAYFRGVASGENANHSGPQPTVGMYLDEQPITTIQGAVDLHLYDIARVEALAGPQGTLYGASSEAGTIRIITNKPDPSGFDAGYDLEINTIENGSEGYIAQGFVNVPVGESAAIRLVGWYEDNSGYIDNKPATRTFPTSGGCITNIDPPPPGCTLTPSRAKDDYNEVKTYGARAALGINLNDSWTITPSVMGQKQESDGTFAFSPNDGDLAVAHFYPERSEDKWWQAALTVEGKVGNFDIVYAGAYLKRDDFVDSDYSDYSFFYDSRYCEVNYPGDPTCSASGNWWYDDSGTPLADPSQFINGTDYYKRQSHEIRITSPADNRARFVAGLFYQDQEHEIYQNYQINNLSPDITVSEWPDTIWLTNQLRKDEDSALFGEVSFDATDKLTLTAGARFYDTESSLVGFFGFAEGYSESYGELLCFQPLDTRYSPCVNLDDSVDDSGEVFKGNVTYRINPDAMVYVTYSEGFRPGGINRNNAPPNPPQYKPDTLTNYEMGWKTTWAGNRLRFNGAVFFEQWDDIQFSFLPPSGSGLTIIRNAGSADIKGIEADISWAITDDFMLYGGGTYIDTELKEDFIEEPGADPAAFAGQKLPLTPDFKGNLTARYSFSMGEFDAFVQGSAVYSGSSWSDLKQNIRDIFGKQDAYTIADFSAGMERNGLTFELYVNNAFDERARLWTFAGCEESICGVQPYYLTNQPRTVGLKFGQRF